MPRLARITIPGVPHHVTQRGNNRQDIFFAEEDRSTYLECLIQCAADAGLGILGYCLMTNHVHLLLLPRDVDSLAAGLGRAHWRYSQRMNRLYGRTGHLWQGRFFSCALDEEHAYRALVYIERNPVRAKMVPQAWAYSWSSARVHVGAAEPPEWLEMKRWSRWSDFAHWKTELRRGEKEEVEDLLFHTRRGRPLGSDHFVADLETRLGHRLRPFPVGRPKKLDRRLEK
jgi:putative transposase